jgi:SP family general alpha glucoside:H+ symporter-like MFS transporter
MVKTKIVPTEELTDRFDLDRPEVLELIHQAQESDAADRKLTVFEALKKYKKAVSWAMFLSTSLIMEGYDLVMIASFYGQTQFQNRFGIFDEGVGHNVIPARWQSGLSNSALVGQLAGLLLNAWAQDRYGCRQTMMFFMAVMAITIFIPVFSPSLSVLAFGESMCGIPWGVFQVRVYYTPRY